MQTFLIIIGIVAVIAGIYFILIKLGKIGDRDGDYIADEIEDTIDDVKDEVNKAKRKVNKKVKQVKTRVNKVIDELEDVGEEISDVISAIKGKPTKSKLSSLTKQQLIDAAKKDHSTDFDLSVKKSTLVNKVYSLYNKK
jgi:F0F1-type ATP synthase membrane subunit b/b'